MDYNQPPLFTEHGILVGELSNADDIWEAINELSTDRIGHGLAAINDKDLFNFIKEKHMPIELCPTSNFITGAISSFVNHPIKKWWRINLI
jgi:adenosine deaminase